MKYGSVCSGVEAATAAWHPLGWEPQWFSEIEKFPSAVLAHHYPNVPNLGDMTKFKEWPSDRSIDLLAGGTPCQSFSVAGLRKGLDDPRGNLMLTYLAIAAQYQPKWLVWENVPGVLSSNRGRDFGTFLGALGQLGYGFAYRVLDAQYWGVAQRRRRVFVVGYLGDWRRAAAVLFERESMSGHPAPSRETREEAPGYTAGSFGGYREGVGTVRAAGGDLGGGSETLVAKWPAEVASTLNAAFGSKQDLEDQHISGGAPLFVPSPQVRRLTSTEPVAFAQNQSGEVREGNVFNTLNTNSNASGRNSPLLRQSHTVRRLTPIETERLQGFCDNYTRIPYRNKPAENCPDGPRYKAMGNSMAVPVMRWIGKRIQILEETK